MPTMKKRRCGQKRSRIGTPSSRKKACYGCKGQIGVDEGLGVIRKKAFTSADVHDSKEADALISGDEQSVFADKAYPSGERKRDLRRKGVWCGGLKQAVLGEECRGNLCKARP